MLWQQARYHWQKQQDPMEIEFFQSGFFPQPFQSLFVSGISEKQWHSCLFHMTEQLKAEMENTYSPSAFDCEIAAATKT
jgi:hypothetical protein